MVTAAQSFHWFAIRAAVEEIHRVLTPSGSFGMFWSLEDTSVPWVKDLYEFMWPIFDQKSIVHPYRESWKTLFDGLCQQLFSTPKEKLSFRHRFPFSIEQAYEFYSSYSVIAGGSEQTKKAFKEILIMLWKNISKEVEFLSIIFPFKFICTGVLRQL